MGEHLLGLKCAEVENLKSFLKNIFLIACSKNVSVPEII